MKLFMISYYTCVLSTYAFFHVSIYLKGTYSTETPAKRRPVDQATEASAIGSPLPCIPPLSWWVAKYVVCNCPPPSPAPAGCMHAEAMYLLT